MIVIFWIALCLLVGKLASKKGRSFVGYCVLSVFLSPLIGLFVVLILGATVQAEARRTVAVHNHLRLVTPNEQMPTVGPAKPSTGVYDKNSVAIFVAIVSAIVIWVITFGGYQW